MKIREILNENNVIKHKFEQRLRTKKGLMYNPDLEPPFSRKDGKPFDRFEVEILPSGRVGVIFGVRKDGYKETISTAHAELAKALAAAYNAGGYTKHQIEKVPLADYFENVDDLED